MYNNHRHAISVVWLLLPSYRIYTDDYVMSHLMQEGYVGFFTEVRMSPNPFMNWRVNALVIGPALMRPCSFPFNLSELPEKMLDGSKAFILLFRSSRTRTDILR